MAAGRRVCRGDVASAEAYAARRPGAVSFSVRTATRQWGGREDRSAPSASVVKALLLVTYLNHPCVRGCGLSRPERLRLAAMIRRSDNDAATRVRDVVGTWRLARTARRAGMRHFRTNSIWGLSRVTARDLTRFMVTVDQRAAARKATLGGVAARLLRGL